MKKYYSVKEASKAIGVSTNTIYKYLEEGKLESRRVGKGRFKILASAVEPYLPKTEKINQIVEAQVHGEAIANSLKEKVAIKTDAVIPYVNDSIFMKIYVGLFLLGTLVINFVDLYSSGLWIQSHYPVLLSITLIASLACLTSVFVKINQLFSNLISVTVMLSLAGLMYYSFHSGHYGTLTTAGAFLILFFLHGITGFFTNHRQHDFFAEFTHYSMYAVVLIALMLLISPDYSSVAFLTDELNGNVSTFVLGWLMFLIPSSFLVMTDWFKKTKLYVPFYLFGTVMAFWNALEASYVGYFQGIYISLLYCIFAIFVVWWQEKQIVVRAKNFGVLTAGFTWIAISILIAGAGLYTLRERVKNNYHDRLSKDLYIKIDELESYVNQVKSNLVSASNNFQLRTAVEENNSEVAVNFSKSIVEGSAHLNRGLVLNSEGIAIGVYPHDTLIFGTNFVNREYFSIPKSTLNGNVSTLFESVILSDVIAVSEPIINENGFLGVTVAGLDLVSLSKAVQSSDNSISLHATDSNNKVVLSKDTEQIGETYKKPPYLAQNVEVSDHSRVLGWHVRLIQNVEHVFRGLSEVIVGVFLVLGLNALITLWWLFNYLKGQKNE